MSRTSVALAMLVAHLGLALASDPPSAIVIGHGEASAVTNLPPSTMDSIGQLRWYFAHASVGANMVGGLTDLHDSDAGRYLLNPVAAGAVPPLSTLSGCVYEYDRGNPGWQAKVDTFAGYVTNGWRYPKMNLVLNKFCYIDQDANVDAYIQSLAELETNFPETVFIYATMPIMNTTDLDNYTRSVFNDALRSWVATHARVLLDIADIEAHDTNAVAQTFIYNSRTCQRLFSGYTTDGGHLNALGSREVAKGFYALGAALFDADRDGDGLSDGAELIAGSSPCLKNSCFGLDVPVAGDAGEMVFCWASTSNRSYTLQRRVDLGDAAGWTNLITNVVSTPPMNTCTDDAASAATGFYRVTVRQ